MAYRFKLQYILSGLLLTFLISNPASAGHLEASGDILAVVIPGAAYASTFYLDDKEGRYQFYKSFLTTSLITHGLKTVVGKTRPDGSDNRSFPSGHTSASFQGAAFIHKRYGWDKAVLPYLASAYIGYTRVETNKHDWIDVSAGAVLGIASSWLLTTEKSDQQIVLYNDGGRWGFFISRRL